MTLVETISLLCEQRGTSLYQVERATGLRNIYRWDTVSPSFEKVVRLADYFGVSVDSLLGRTTSSQLHHNFNTTSEVAQAYDAADEVTKEMVRRILGIKKEALAGYVG